MQWRCKMYRIPVLMLKGAIKECQQPQILLSCCQELSVRMWYVTIIIMNMLQIHATAIFKNKFLEVTIVHFSCNKQWRQRIKVVWLIRREMLNRIIHFSCLGMFIILHFQKWARFEKNWIRLNDSRTIWIRLSDSAPKNRSPITD